MRGNTGTGDKSLAISAWPNPAASVLNLSVTQKNQVTAYDFYDMAGKLIMSVPADDKKASAINVQIIDGGVYLIRARGKFKTPISTRVIIKR